MSVLEVVFSKTGGFSDTARVEKAFERAGRTSMGYPTAF
jgi:hypothetical protein